MATHFSLPAIKTAIRRALRTRGWDLHHYSPARSEWAALHRMLETHRISVVLDVGANEGQFARSLREAGFQGRIVSFEPISSVHARLSAAAKADPLWTVPPPVALGDREGSIRLNLSANTGSSSVLSILPAHVEAAADSDFVGSEVVQMERLDSVYRNYVGHDDRVFLKMDVQGFESQVLKGAQVALADVQGLQVELSLVELYAGQATFWDLSREITNEGFELWSLMPAFIDPKSGRLLQVDGIFFRNSHRGASFSADDHGATV